MTPEPSFSKLLRAAQAQSIARDCATESGANRLVVIPARRRVGPRPMTVSARGPRVRIGNFAVHQGREVGILKRAAVGWVLDPDPPTVVPRNQLDDRFFVKTTATVRGERRCDGPPRWSSDPARRRISRLGRRPRRPSTAMTGPPP